MAQLGDTKKFRKALMLAGFERSPDRPIYNDNAAKSVTVNRKRRLKLWNANEVVFAPLAQQQRLADELKKQFGDRLIEMYSIPDAAWAYRDARSLCIRLWE